MQHLCFSSSSRRAVVFIALLGLSSVGLIAQAEVMYEMVAVGDAENAADNTGYGAVACEFLIGKYEVTISQYTAFLNATAKSDPYGLYNPLMGTNLNIAGISRSGLSGSFTYSVMNNGGNSANRPITFVSWFDAARFANWMHNGQASGGTEAGAYTLVNGQTSGTAPARNPEARFYIPTENEWYKAAFYKGGGANAGYWTYAMRSDSAPGNTIGGATNQANYLVDGPGGLGVYAITQSAIFDSSQNYLTDVGAYTASLSAYGTFDQSGNVGEWNDLTGTAGLFRGIRGGFWAFGGAGSVSSMYFTADETSNESYLLGFRLASPAAVPEPSTWVMGAGGIAYTALSVFRRRKRA